VTVRYLAPFVLHFWFLKKCKETSALNMEAEGRSESLVPHLQVCKLSWQRPRPTGVWIPKLISNA